MITDQLERILIIAETKTEVNKWIENIHSEGFTLAGNILPYNCLRLPPPLQPLRSIQTLLSGINIL